MKSTEHWLVHDHTQFENLLGQCMEAGEIEDWWALEQAFNELVKLLKYHMAQEEEVLFPAYETRMSGTQKPTAALYGEHDQIVQLVKDTAAVLKKRDPETVLESLVSLVSLMIKHHEKEEDIFLPMAGHILASDREELSMQLDKFKLSEKSRDWSM